MEFRDGPDKAETKPDPRRSPTCIAAIEPFHGFGFLGVGNTRAVVGDRDLHGSVGPAACPNGNNAVIGRVLERIVDEIPNCLRQQKRIARDRHRGVVVRCQGHTL